MTATTVTSAGYIAGTKRPVRLLQLNRKECNESIGTRAFTITHDVAQHPLMSLEAIAKLADSLPAAAVECHAAKLPVLMPGGREGDKVKASDIVRTIESSGRWMVLWNIEQHPEYRQLIDELLDEVAPHLSKRERGMGRREAFLFLSAPGAVTPVHIDPENNFLLQLRGTKQMMVGRFPDRSTEQHELDRYHDGGHRNLEQLPLQAGSYQMMSGDGVHIPPFVPHWVYNGPTASLSLSITFRTGRSHRTELAHRCNALMRRRGFHPRPVGENAFIDWCKAAYIGTKGWLRRGGRPERGARDLS
ncbi:MAG: cupin domain-containing protein [Pseudomonadota bacterium]